MATRKIRLPQGAIASIKINPRDTNVLTIFKFTASVDQMVAEAMDIKDTIYDSNGSRRAGCRGYSPELELFGATIELIPEQTDLFSPDLRLLLKSIKVDDVKILRAKADETLKLSFKITVAGIPREALDFVETIKKSTTLIIIERPTKDQRDTAQMQAMDFGLFKKPKENKDKDEPAKDATEDPEEAPEGEEVKETGTLARAGQMGKLRGRRGAAAKNVQ